MNSKLPIKQHENKVRRSVLPAIGSGGVSILITLEPRVLDLALSFANSVKVRAASVFVDRPPYCTSGAQLRPALHSGVRNARTLNTLSFPSIHPTQARCI